MLATTTDLAKRETITALVGAYQKAEQEIRQAYSLLEAAQKGLDAAFIAGQGISYGFCVNSDSRYGGPGIGKEAADNCMKKLKRDAWKVIVERLEIRRILSIKRREELDRQLNGERLHYDDKPAELPDVTEANIVAMFQEGMEKAGDYAKEAVYEVFDWLRPSPIMSQYKTNEKWKVGSKVILGWTVESGYGRGKFRVNYHRDKNVTALDNVFHMLDGRGPLKTYHGPLSDAINNSPDGTGETDFFKFKSFKNGNLHLEFKRLDLVAKINQIAGGNRLKDAA